MRAWLLRPWTTGIGVALAGMLCGLAVMAVAVSADDGDAAEGGCPSVTVTPTEEATPESNAAMVRSLHSTTDENSAACPGEGGQEPQDEAPGNSGAAHSCPFGGEEGESGESYRNHGECVSEAAHRRNEERRAARHGTPTPTGTATATPTATPSGSGSAATAGVTRPGRGQREREDEGDGHRRGGGGPGVAGGGAGGQGGASGGPGNGHGTGSRYRR
jgi:translation initiation factor IF-2